MEISNLERAQLTSETIVEVKFTFSGKLTAEEIEQAANSFREDVKKMSDRCERAVTTFEPMKQSISISINK